MKLDRIAGISLAHIQNLCHVTIFALVYLLFSDMQYWLDIIIMDGGKMV